MTRLVAPISGHANPNIFWLDFNLCEFVSTCKKSGYFINSFWRYGWLKMLQSDWMIIFWPISQELEFSQIWDFCRNKANNIHFHYRTNSVKINGNIFQYIQKVLFLAHFPNFWGKKFFLENPALSCTTGFLVSCQNLEKTNDTIPRKRPDRRKDGWKDGRMGRPYFIGPFWLTMGVRLKENEFDFHFSFQQCCFEVFPDSQKCWKG